MASLSGDKSNHDSYMVLFQNRNEKVAHDDYMSTVKPSDLHGSAKGRRYMKELPCQTLKSFHLATKKQELPSSFLSNEFHYEVGIGEKIISLLRTNEVMTREVFLPTWAGIHSLVSTSNSTLKKVGFLPLIPHPITKIETVFTCLRSLKSIAERLSQPVLPIACDGVYSLVVQIWLQQPEMFNNIYPMLGTFHMTKSALKCAGKYIRGSGAEDAFIETQIACTAVTVSLPNASSTLVTKLAAICPSTSSNRGIVRFLFAIRDFKHTRPWVVPASCSITAYTAAATPCLLASPKAYGGLWIKWVDGVGPRSGEP